MPRHVDGRALKGRCGLQCGTTWLHIFYVLIILSLFLGPAGVSRALRFHPVKHCGCSCSFWLVPRPTYQQNVRLQQPISRVNDLIIVSIQLKHIC